MKNYEKNIPQTPTVFHGHYQSKIDSAKKLIIDQFHRETLFALRTRRLSGAHTKAIMKHLGF